LPAKYAFLDPGGRAKQSDPDFNDSVATIDLLLIGMDEIADYFSERFAAD
jgi:hypothetical protein